MEKKTASGQIDCGTVDTPEPWRWHPNIGRWRPEFGVPRTPAVVRITTDAAPVRDRYDFWRELVFYNFDADPLDHEASRYFTASGHGTPAEVAEIYHWRSSAMQGRRKREQIGRDGEDTIALGFVLSGERTALQADERVLVGCAGEPFIYDSAQECQLRWTDHEGIYIWLRRPAVTAAFGTDVPPVSELTDRLRAAPMIGMVRDQLTAISRSFADLSGPERAFVLEQASKLATFVLLRVGERKPTDDRSARASVYVAAMRLIERNLSVPDLGPTRLAAALKCSRTTLYRAFADQGETVVGAITATRFERAQELLLATAPEVPVGDVAARCGFYDQSNFSARFRRRFGYRPGDLRSTQPHSAK